MLISLETKSTPSYTEAFKTWMCANVNYVCPRNVRSIWFESDYNIVSTLRRHNLWEPLPAKNNVT